MKFQSFAFDAKKTFKASTTAEVRFAKALKQVAKAAGHIIDTHTDGAAIIDEKSMTKQLNEYAKLLEPWARRQSAKLLEQVLKANKRAFNNKSKKMADALDEVAESNVGAVALTLLYEQVNLIKSIPLEAGLRAQEIAYKNFLAGGRAVADPGLVNQFLNERRALVDLNNEFARASGQKELAEDMARSTEVAVNRAKLIARTETARSNAYFTQARSQSVGALKYRWHSTKQSNSRHSHNKMDGKIIEYSKPPTLSDGTTGHAGTFPNCMCWQDPLFED